MVNNTLISVIRHYQHNTRDPYKAVQTRLTQAKRHLADHQLIHTTLPCTGVIHQI